MTLSYSLRSLLDRQCDSMPMISQSFMASIAPNLALARKVPTGPLGATWICNPPEALQECVESVYAMHWQGPSRGSVLLLPDLRCHICFISSPKQHQLVFVTPRIESVQVQVPPDARILGICAKPGSSATLLDSIPLKTRAPHPLGSCIQLPGATPIEWFESDWSKALTAFQNDLSEHFEDAGTMTRGLMSAIKRTSIALFGKIPQLAERLGMHQRTLSRHIQKRLEISPQRMKMTSRRQRAMLAIAADKPQAWIMMAQDLGYNDQSHFISDIRSTTGYTPLALHKIFSYSEDNQDLVRELGLLPVPRPLPHQTPVPLFES